MSAFLLLIDQVFSIRKGNFSVCILLIVVSIFFPQTASFGQGPLAPLWNYRYGGDSIDGSTTFIRTNDDGYVFGGYSTSGANGDKTEPSRGSFDFWVVKTDSAGIMQFNFRFGGLSQDILTAIKQTTDGGYLLGGYSSSGISGDKTQNSRGLFDFWILKTDASLNKLWDRRFGGNDNDQLYDVFQTADGGYVLGGWTASGANGDVSDTSRGGIDYWVLKTDSSGNKLWDKRYGGDAQDIFARMTEMPDGGFLLCGSSASDSSGEKTQDSHGSNDYWILRIDSVGDILWDRRFGGSGTDFTSDIELIIDGGVIVGGWSDSPMDGDKSEPPVGGQDFWVVKIDTLGNKIWDRVFGGIANEDDFGNIIQTLDSGLLITGTSYSNIGGSKSEDNLGLEQGWLIKTDQLGNQLWDKTIFTTGHDETALTMQSADGCFLISIPTQAGIGGYKTQDTRGFNDFWIIKLCDSTQLPSADFIASDFEICPGTCINYLNNSINALTYEWIFPGGVPASSTDSVPSQICYSNPGTYDAILIANNFFSSDTLVLNNYITVFPQTAPQSIIQVNDTLYSNQGFVTYQWYFNGTLINGASDYFYFPLANGDYNVVCSDSNGCELEAVIYNVFTSADHQIHQAGIELFPNPVYSTLHVRLFSPKFYHWQTTIKFSIFDITGNEVLSPYLETGSFFGTSQLTFRIELGKLAGGVYWLQTDNDGEVVRNKFILSPAR